MKRSLSALAVFVTLAATAASSTLCFDAAAQAKPAKGPKRKPIRDELPEAARKNWEAARELFEAKDFGGALIEFQRAYDASKNPRVLFNMGVCEKSMKRYSRAVARWKQQIVESEGKLTPEEKQEIEETIAAVQQFVSSVEIMANEPGATLVIDTDESGQTPFAQPVAIDVGRHALKLRKEGFQEQTKDVTIASGKTEKVQFKLEPLVRKTLVSVLVTGAPTAIIVMDGTEMGRAPFKGEIAAGRHTFEARAPGFVAARQTSDVVYKEPLNLTLTLSAERHEGKVKVTVTKHEDATIALDGKVVGSGAWEGILPSGGHQLVVKKPGYQTYSTDLAINDDQVRSVPVDLVGEQKGAAWIWWSVGAVAIIGGGVAASYFILTPAEPVRVSGTLKPPGDLVPTSLHRF